MTSLSSLEVSQKKKNDGLVQVYQSAVFAVVLASNIASRRNGIFIVLTLPNEDVRTVEEQGNKGVQLRALGMVVKQESLTSAQMCHTSNF